MGVKGLRNLVREARLSCRTQSVGFSGDPVSFSGHFLGLGHAWRGFLLLAQPGQS